MSPAAIPTVQHEPAGEIVDQLELSIQPRVSALSGIAELIEQFGEQNGIPDGIIYMVSLWVDELTTNYVRYAAHRVRRPRLHLKLQLYPRVVRVQIDDTGPPFDPRHVEFLDMQSRAEESDVGGIGIHLVREHVDRLTYTVIGQHNRIVLERDIPEPLVPAADDGGCSADMGLGDALLALDLPAPARGDPPAE